MNIYINNYCNQRCPYCFAVDYMGGKEKKEMSLDNFKKVLAFLKKSRFMKLRLEGGESTLHPLFEDFIDLSLSRGFTVDLFTNGQFGGKVRKFLYLRNQYLTYIWNINHPSFYARDNWKKLKSNIAKLTAGNSLFGVNVYNLEQDLSYMYDLCKAFKPRMVRYVFAHQTGGDSLVSTIHPRDLHKIIPRVIGLTKQLGEELGVKLMFDCGFIPCIWPDHALAVFVKYGTIFNYCYLCPGIDTDLNVSHCFQTYKENDKKKLTDFKNSDELYMFLRDVKDKYRDLNLFPKCRSCYSRKLNVCDGGCLGDRKAIAKGWDN